MTDTTNKPVELAEDQLEDANGGIGLLLPAVQKVREAAARAGDGSVKPVSGVVQSSGGNGI